jgi:hypothetical protein
VFDATLRQLLTIQQRYTFEVAYSMVYEVWLELFV